MYSKLNFSVVLIGLILFSNTVFATDYTVNSASQFNSLSLQPCDVVTWTNGTYSDQDINFTGMGVSGSPIVLKAETPGGVIFTGSSEMNIWGDYLIVDGFYWNGGTGTNNHVEFRQSGSNSNFANNCIFRNCAFNDLITIGDDKSRWTVLYGTNNTIENCSFLNKDSTGVCILVELDYHTVGAAGHNILNNYFYGVTPKDGRTNSGDSEGIRIGSSSDQTKNAGVLVENNYFKEVDGENEIISNKSLGNTFRNNTFRNCRGSLVLRHGAQALVEGNYFMGENKAKSGGIRVSDQDHIIINNYIQDLDNNSDSYNNGNIFGGSTIGVTDSGITDANANFSLSGDIYKPSTTGPAANASAGTYNEVIIDIEGLTRPNTGKDVGAHEIVGASGTVTNPAPIVNASVGNEVGACYLDFDGMASSSTCPTINYGTSCAPIAVTGVVLSPQTANIMVNQTQQLTATITPSNATNTQITWSSGDNAIATVDTNGLVTAVSPGTVIITVTTVDGSFTDTASIEVLAPLTPPNCVMGTNLSLSATVVSFTAQQAANPASNVIDGDTSNRWSAETFPQSMVFDLGDGLNVNEINLYPFQGRDYQYLVEGSQTSATAGYITLVDRQANTTGGTFINDTFTLEVVRYIRLTVTGAATYTGPWVSINDLQVICAGSTLSVDENALDLEIKVFPNPFINQLNIEIPSNKIETISKIRLLDAMGRVIQENKNNSQNMSLNFNSSLSNGLYFVQIIGVNNTVLNTRKVIRK